MSHSDNTTGLRLKKNNFAYGVDLGWVSQLEQLGYTWINENGNGIDPIRACRDMGANAVRLRIFADPKGSFWQKSEEVQCMLGLCDSHSVLEAAGRVKALDMDLMLDFHYSDHFADPEIQDIPEAWKDDDDRQLEERVYSHTRETLLLFREHHIEPKWVQVGNEINFGMLWPKGHLNTAPEQLVRFLNAGYRAVKEVFPDCRVITHMAAVTNEAWCVPFLDNFFECGGKTDIIGFSFYPYWIPMQENQCSPTEGGIVFAEEDKDGTGAGYKTENSNGIAAGCTNDLCGRSADLGAALSMYESKYGKPVMIVEIGGEDDREEETYQLLRDSVEAVRSVPGGRGLGVFYWEPEAPRSVLPDAYPLGAARQIDDHTLQFTKVLTAYSFETAAK